MEFSTLQVPNDVNGGSSRRGSLSTSRRRPKKAGFTGDPEYDAAERSRRAAAKAPTMSNEQVQIATAVYDAHGGVAAHLDLMLQALSLPPTSTIAELRERHRVVQFQIPLGKFLDIVREVYEENAAREALAVFQSAVGMGDMADVDMATTRAQRQVEADARAAYEALLAEDSDAGPKSPQLSAFPTVTTPTGSAFHHSSHHRQTPMSASNNDASSRPEEDSDAVLRQIIEPLKQRSYDEFREAVVPRDENPVFVKAFMRLGATRSEEGLGLSLDTQDLVSRCDSIGLADDEQQAIINLFDEDCSGDIDFDEFKAIMTGDLDTFGLKDGVVAALRKLLGQPQRSDSVVSLPPIASASGSAGGASIGGASMMTAQRKRTQTLFSKVGIRVHTRRRTLARSVRPVGGETASDIGDDDDDDEHEDPAIRELHILEGMRHTVDNAESQERDGDAVVQRVNQFADDIQARHVAERRREEEDRQHERDERKARQEHRRQKMLKSSSKHTATADQTHDGSKSPSADGEPRDHPPVDDDQAAAHDGGASVRSGTILPPIQPPRGQPKVSYRERANQQKLHFTLDDHRRRTAMRERARGKPYESVVRTQYMTGRTEESQLAPAIAATRSGGVERLVPANVVGDSTAADQRVPQTARTRHIVPRPPQGAGPDGGASGSQTSRGRRRAELGSRGQLYRTILRDEYDASKDVGAKATSRRQRKADESHPAGEDNAGYASARVTHGSRRASSMKHPPQYTSSSKKKQKSGTDPTLELISELSPRTGERVTADRRKAEADPNHYEARARSPAEVDRIIADNRAREARLARHAKHRLEMFAAQQEKAQNLYETAAVRLVAANRKPKDKKPDGGRSPNADAAKKGDDHREENDDDEQPVTLDDVDDRRDDSTPVDQHADEEPAAPPAS